MSTSTSVSTPWLQNIFGVDLRSLALFRVLLGAVLFCTLINSLCHVGTWYSDSGIAPRAWVMDASNAMHFSLYFLEGSVWFAAALLLTQIICALMLMLGWRTRYVTIISFVLWTSLMNRNPDIEIPADQMIAGLLFWSLFLPMAAHYSVDAAFAAPQAPAKNQYASWASAGLLIQVIAPYFFSTLASYAESQTLMTPALYYWFNLDAYTSTLAQSLKLQFPVHPTLHIGLISLNLLSPLLIFAPVRTQRTRLVAMACFTLMQIFILIMLDAGPLPWVSLAALTVLPGALIWDGLKRRDERRNSGALHIYYDGEHLFSRRMCRVLQELLILPRAEIHPAQDTPRTRSLMQANRSWVVLDADDQATMKWAALLTLLKRSPVFFWAVPLLSASFVQKTGDALYDALAKQRTRLDRHCVERAAHLPAPMNHWWASFSAFVLFAFLLSSFTAVQWLPPGVGGSLAPLLQVLRLDQTWTLYSVSKLENGGWLMVPAKLADHSETDLLRADGAEPDFSKPPHAVIAADGVRWLGYRKRLWEDETSGHRYQYARYLCKKWNDAHTDEPAKLATQLTFIYMLKHTPPPGHSTPQIEQNILGTQDCLPVKAEQLR